MSFAQRYHEFILWIGAVTGQNDTVLHIHAGLAILVLARIVSGRSFGTFIPFAVVLAAELANERGELMTRNAAGIALKNALSARVRCSFVSNIPFFL